MGTIAELMSEAVGSVDAVWPVRERSEQERE